MHAKLIATLVREFPSVEQIDDLAAKIGARWNGTDYESIEQEPPLQDHELASWDGDPGYF